MRRFLQVAALVLVLALAFTTTSLAQSRPEFKLGFKALADLIPDVVGEPLENEHWGANGDSLQLTSKGLMAWRKADNWTAFTNGARTWVNGPFGVMERANDERFEWEAATPKVGSSRLAPVPFGQTGTYTDSQGRTFDVTVLQVQRNAYADLKARGLVSSVTKAPQPGYDFLTIQVRLHYVLGDPKQSYRTSAIAPRVLAQDKLWSPDLFTQLRPFISQEIFPGATIEGWIGPVELPVSAMDEAMLNYGKLWLALK